MTALFAFIGGIFRSPTCPKCGCTMTGGAPHGGGTVQWECRACGVYFTE